MVKILIVEDSNHDGYENECLKGGAKNTVIKTYSKDPLDGAVRSILDIQ